MSHDHRTDATDTVHRLEPWTPGDCRMAIGRLRSMGRHDLADAPEKDEDVETLRDLLAALAESVLDSLPPAEEER